MPKISIVMPVHNSEQYLYESLLSLEMQIFSDFEVICVDDGSNDTSLNIIEDFCLKDCRFKIIKNEFSIGAAEARNKGLEEAKGEFVIFLDSDDYFYDNLLSTIYKLAVEYNADMVIFGYDVVTMELVNGVESEGKLVKKVSNFEVVEESNKKGDLLQIIAHVPWNKMVNRNLLTNHQIKFQNIPNNNDIYYSFVCTLSAKKIIISDKNLLLYRYKRVGSLSNYRLLVKSYFLQAFDKVYEHIVTQTFDQSIKYGFLNYVVGQILGFITDKEKSETVRTDILHQFKEMYLNKWNITLLPKDKLNIKHQVFIRKIINDSNENILNMNLLDIEMGVVDALIREAHSCNKSISLWGCGKLGKKLLDNMERYKIYVDYVIDNNPSLSGGEYGGYKIYNYRDVMNSVDIILITNRKWLNEITKQTKDIKKIICL